MTAPSRVAVVGPGAIGSSLAAALAQAGRARVTLGARTRFDELVVESDEGTFRARLPVATSPGEAGEVDWVLLATKAHQTPAAAAWLRELAGRGARVAVAQNGVEHEARVRPYVGGAPVVPIVVACPAERLGPGHARRRGPLRLSVPEGPEGRAFRDLFEGSVAQIECAEDFTSVAWAKLCFNVPAAVAALTGSSMGVLRRPDVAELARGLVEEAARVGRAEGARLDDALAASIVDAIARGRADARPSIVQDALARRPLEYDARNGAVVRAGARHGVATPLNAAVTALLAALSEGFERG
ncbi:MAG TPA: 2-dehydropantoate 2-reductase [Polyangiaceae bacterium]|nr:2-dehydropantoate 2-reductase [Polyangiaceae bacterium]